MSVPHDSAFLRHWQIGVELDLTFRTAPCTGSCVSSLPQDWSELDFDLEDDVFRILVGCINDASGRLYLESLDVHTGRTKSVTSPLTRQVMGLQGYSRCRLDKTVRIRSRRGYRDQELHLSFTAQHVVPTFLKEETRACI